MKKRILFTLLTAFTSLAVFAQDTASSTTTFQVVKCEGLTAESLLRGVIGMVSLLLIAFIFSSNRRAINWRTVGIGLLLQIGIAIGILKVSFVQQIFDFVGGIFVLILDFTRAGSDFLLGNLVNTESVGYIFVFQVLPTIVFFSALTSLLFYLGIIQVVVRAMALVLSKLLNISGAESLSVTGNIFLGQTEAPLMIKAYLSKMKAFIGSFGNGSPRRNRYL